MAKTSKTILFFGNERLATGVSTELPVLRCLLAEGYKIAAIITNYTQSNGRQNRQLEVANFANEYEIPLLIPRNLSEIFGQLSEYRADVGVLAAYGKLVPQSVIDLFPAGIVNLHPSLLPAHRGPTPIESTILHGETTAGVSLMSLAKAMDAGPIYAQSTVTLTGDETKQALADQLGELGATMIRELLPEIIAGTIVAAPQSNEDATYDALITKADSSLDWHKPAEQLSREVRAFAGWPGSRTDLGSVEVSITAAHAVPATMPKQPGHIQILADTNSLVVDTTDGYLCIDRLKPAGKNEMSAAEFVRGYQGRLS
ncbi:methionyl-tRNA formyltransferase [Candidatus Saccharibacteria bacterium]|nr:methionyl-tRNA formyltransferase [Candidatus Saccharibacteria bacterium]